MNQIMMFVTLTCKECGGEFLAPEQKETETSGPRVDRLYCSTDCYESHSKRPHNIGHKKQKYGSNWSKMRAATLERDCHRCRKCGEKESDLDSGLHVHHIVPVREFSVPEEGNTLNNLVSLCATCHNKVEGDVAAGIALV